MFPLVQSHIPAGIGAGADPLELEAALQQLKVEHKEQSRASVDAAGNCTERTLTVAKVRIYSHFFFAMYSKLQVQRVEGKTVDEFRYLWTTIQSNAQDQGWEGGVSGPEYQGKFVTEGKQQECKGR